MTKQEFQDRAFRPCTEEQYKTIEFVYTYHPSINNTDGKDQIAYLYSHFGYRIILDMLPTAETAKEYEDSIRELQYKLELSKQGFKDLAEGVEDNGKEIL